MVGRVKIYILFFFGSILSLAAPFISSNLPDGLEKTASDLGFNSRAQGILQNNISAWFDNSYINSIVSFLGFWIVVLFIWVIFKFITLKRRGNNEKKII